MGVSLLGRLIKGSQFFGIAVICLANNKNVADCRDGTFHWGRVGYTVGGYWGIMRL